MIIYNYFKDNQIYDAANLFIEVFNSPPWNENWTLEYAIQRIETIFKTPGFRGIVCLEDSNSEIVGFCIGNDEAWENRKVFYLNELCIKPSYQQRGIGKKLINRLERELNHLEVNQIYLSTIRKKEGPKDFFSKLGYIVEEERITMLKKLK